MVILNNIFLWAAILLCCYAVYKYYLISSGKTKSIRVSEASDKAYLILLAAAAFIAVFIRVYKFGSVPGGFNQDGAMAAVDAKALADYGTDR